MDKSKTNCISAKGVKVHSVQCALCDETFPDENVVLAHLLSNHNTKKPFLVDLKLVKRTEETFKCNSCDKTFSSEEKLQTHVKSFHTNTYSCKACYKSFSLTEDLRKNLIKDHIQKDSLVEKEIPKEVNKGKNACSSCSQTFTFKTSLLRHVEALHNHTKHCCDSCNKEFSHKDSLKRHIMKK